MLLILNIKTSLWHAFTTVFPAPEGVTGYR